MKPPFLSLSSLLSATLLTSLSVTPQVAGFLAVLACPLALFLDVTRNHEPISLESDAVPRNGPCLTGLFPV